jgi:hypothetical protein
MVRSGLAGFQALRLGREIKRTGCRAVNGHSMIPKSGNRFSDKIMRKSPKFDAPDAVM